MKAQFRTSTMNRFTRLMLMGILASFAAVFGQDSGQLSPLLDSISPTSAEAGTEGLAVTFTLSSESQLPPDEVLPTAAVLGAITGSSVTRVDSTTVTAVFSIPADHADETVDASVTFPGPNGDFSFILPDGFSIGAGGGDTENGLVFKVSGSYDGYTLLAPTGQSTAYLLNHDGDVVHEWTCQGAPALSTYLLDNGTLLRTSSITDGSSPFAGAAGVGGSIECYAKDSMARAVPATQKEEGSRECFFVLAFAHNETTRFEKRRFLALFPRNFFLRDPCALCGEIICPILDSYHSCL